MKSDTIKGQFFTYPFSAIVGQEKLKLALLLNAVDPGLGGVLIKGERGTGKSTAARALAELLPPIEVVADCPYSCHPHTVEGMCESCRRRWMEGESLSSDWRSVRMVNLPLNVTVDRLVGSFVLERALREGVREFEPGILAEANRSILYVDEVNLLDDHIVDLLLDVAATGVNHVEREGITFSHPSRFIMIGTMNPEEGELRPQLEDRFGLCVEVKGERDPGRRVEIIRRRHRFRENPQLFLDEFQPAQEELRHRIERARELLPHVALSEEILHLVASISSELDVPGHRGDIALLHAARAKAALEGAGEVQTRHVAETAEMVFLHRLRKSPLDGSDSAGEWIEELVKRLAAGATWTLTSVREPGSGHMEGSRQTRVAQDKERTKPAGLRNTPSFAATPGSQAPTTKENHTGTAVAGGSDIGLRDVERTKPTDQTASPLADGHSTGEPFGARLESAHDPIIKTLVPEELSRLPNPLSSRNEGGRRSEAVSGGDRGVVVGSRPYLPGERPEAGNLHLGATLKASALRGGIGESRPPSRDDLQRSLKKHRTGNLILFLVDASASMKVLDRMECAKKAILELLADAYKKRDRVGLVTFRDKQAQLVLAPTSSVQLASLCVREIATGGSTPLCHGLALACQVIKRERRRNPGINPILVVLTDGYGNVPWRSEDLNQDLMELAAEVRREGITCAVFDTLEIQPLGSGRTFRSPSRRLAEALGAAYFRLNSYNPDEVTGPLQTLMAGERR